MKRFALKPIFIFVVLLAFQSACEQTQTVSDNNQNKAENKSANEISNFEVVENKKKKIENYFAHLKPEHKEIVQEWLKSKPSLRPAVEEIDTSLDKSELENIHKKGWTQFYTVADINKDGKKDFAILLVDIKQKDKFALAIFNGKFSKGKTSNYFGENLKGISNIIISYENERDDYFSSSSYLLLYDKKRNDCLGYVPDKNTYKAIVCI